MSQDKTWLYEVGESQDLTQTVVNDSYRLDFKFNSAGIWKGCWLYDPAGNRVIAPLDKDSLNELYRYSAYNASQLGLRQIADGISQLVERGKVVLLDAKTGRPILLNIKLRTGERKSLTDSEKIIKYISLLDEMDRLVADLKQDES